MYSERELLNVQRKVFYTSTEYDRNGEHKEDLTGLLTAKDLT